MRSWHDYQISGYTVDGRGTQQRLVFDLESPHASKTEVRHARLFFAGVECYFLEHDLGVNVVLDFSEVPLRDFLQEWAERFEEESRWGWPQFWHRKGGSPGPLAETLEEAYQYLLRRRVRCFELSTSYGLSGWILAASTWHEITEGLSGPGGALGPASGTTGRAAAPRG